MDFGEETEEPLDTDTPAPKITEGKDELNLAEFPLSAISDRSHADQKTLSFEDRVFDASRGEMVTRQFTISASDQYGLPTAIDDEVVVGLIQLSKMQNFADRKVSFTRYQLIQVLGWRMEGKSYERLEKSLNRWVGVTLYYKGAWWSKADKCWVDEKFHILDNVSLYDRESARHRKGTEQAQLPLSTFTWNDVVFRSFTAGNLKSIDYDFLKGLKSAVSKRLYRFLDKRFYHRKRWEFNLKEVSSEHIGISRNYDVGELKRILRAPIKELEDQGFLKPLRDEERFYKIVTGEYRVVFEALRQSSANREKEVKPDSASLIVALVERGVTQTTAEQTVSTNPADRIKTQLEVFDWLVSQKDPKVSRNPAGFLISSIKSEYAPPKGFLSRQSESMKESQIAERKRKAEERQKALELKEMERQQSQEKAIETFWNSLSEKEKIALELEALALASPIEADVIKRGGPFALATRKAILDSYALKILQEAA